MPGTALDHPLVRDYLRELDAALAALPAQRAGELREQITTHLWDVLGPESSDEEAAAALSRLGSPGELAAEAGAGEAAAVAAADRAPGLRHRLRTAVARLSWRTRLILAAAVIITAAATGYTVAAYTAGGLQIPGGSTGWWYQRDAKRAVDTEADQASQSTAPIRPGQRQGFWFTVYNPSDWSQTVIGFAPGAGQSPDSPNGQLGVATTGQPYPDGAVTYTNHYRLPEVIPPHQWRVIRVIWTNPPCLPGGGAEGSMDTFVLTVRVGLFERTEAVPFFQAYGVSGPLAGTCS
jgi:hypothetical protein